MAPFPVAESYKVVADGGVFFLGAQCPLLPFAVRDDVLLIHVPEVEVIIDGLEPLLSGRCEGSIPELLKCFLELALSRLNLLYTEIVHRIMDMRHHLYEPVVDLAV